MFCDENSINKKITLDYKLLYKTVVNLYNKTDHFKHGPWDETYYTLRVYEISKQLIDHIQKKHGEKVEEDIVLTASLLHDIGKIALKMDKIYSLEEPPVTYKKEWNKHSELGEKIAKEVMKSLKYPTPFIKKVCYLVKNHNNRKLKDKTIELQIVQDADLIADRGICGFANVFMFSGMFTNYSIISSIKFQKSRNFKKEIDKLNLEISKKITSNLIEREVELITEMASTVGSSLL